MRNRNHNWRDPSYLLEGTAQQQDAYHALMHSRVLTDLAAYDPILVGTIPLNLIVAGSDLDIVCVATDLTGFAQELTQRYGARKDFNIARMSARDGEAVVAAWEEAGWPIELFAQAIPCEEQFAYRHMCQEADILQAKGELFRQEILTLKRQGIKTEPAFAQVLGLRGDPYLALLAYQTENPNE